MLIKNDMSEYENPTVSKFVRGADVSANGAFACGDVIAFEVCVSRKLGASAVVLRICEDGKKDTDIPLVFLRTSCGKDTYRVEVDTAHLCGNRPRKSGLFYYEFLFLRGLNTLFTDTHNNVDFTLENHSSGRFLLLVYESGFTTPEWFRGKIMYHIFVDRFCRGEGKIEMRQDAVLNEDWENGIPQFAEKQGDPLSNHVFFGGNLWGIAEKLDYLHSLGVEILYLSPIFRAYSNHKYDTGDYLEIDGMFGGEAAFRNLIAKADRMGIRIILDGVFNHTGDDSRYFDRYGNYGKTGAYSNPDSPFRDWYRFRNYPKEYETWWGIDILPKLNPDSESCREFLAGKGGVAERYIRMGISGWRLDVADELSDVFLDELRENVKSVSDSQAILIGEVWENAAEKISYGVRRRYLQGAQLDSVMNYPFRNAVLAFLQYGDAEFLADTLKAIYSTYPKCVCDCLMNLLGTHDTERILTVLGGDGDDFEEPNAVLAYKKLNGEQRKRGIARLRAAAVLQYTVYGVPSVFYGDEAGMEGYHDPFCRCPFPWGREEPELLAFYRTLGKIRQENPVFVDGDFAISDAKNGVICYSRTKNAEKLTVIVNRNESPAEYPFPAKSVDLLTGKAYQGIVPALSGVILKKAEEK